LFVDRFLLRDLSDGSESVFTLFSGQLHFEIALTARKGKPGNGSALTQGIVIRTPQRGQRLPIAVKRRSKC
jgi:hypothetical protein